ncbi:MAG: type I DNA topoisomerase [Desulfovibrio sp.]|nr:type I DNA topoisomerase [Desulfovibrio sp.]
MAKELIIVESPAKVKTIRKILGPAYAVEASVGHVRDLPSSTLGVDEANGFEPEYHVIPGKEKVVGTLQNEAAKADVTYLAPDPDREGEAIAWHVAELLKGKAKAIKRIQFNEITAHAVKEALAHPRGLDADLFHAQQARRILDRLVGYKISPLLWKTVKRGISAGRVQSVALRLIVDRELEREKFKPEEYWVFRALLQGSEGAPFRADLAKIDGAKAAIACQADAEALEAFLEGAPFTVARVEQKRREKAPQPPFITSTLQQVANQRLGYSAKRTMGIAQRLYEGVELQGGSVQALITYMRTDSTRIAEEAAKAAEEFIASRYGQDYLPGKRRSYKIRANAQDAHEAIRPVDVAITPESVKASLSAEQYSLYKLIWARFVASQMAAAIFMDTRVAVACRGTEWQARGQRELFPGWQKAFPSGERDADLPELKEGESLRLEKIEKEQKFTQPPARFSEASLVRTLEELGIGRPSTYASIISTLEDRSYVDLKEKHFVPTDLGRAVCAQLVANFGKLMDVNFTADMESGLDKVAEGQESWSELLGDFMHDFSPALDAASKNMANLKGGIATSLVCPDCGKSLVIKFGKAGAFLACTGYPACRFTSNLMRNDAGELAIAPKEERQMEVVGTCPECRSPLVVKRSRTGSRFIACSAYPKCRYAAPFSTGVACPQCGEGEIVEKSTKKGKIFYSCSRYPQCEFALWNEPVPEKCPECGSPYLVLRKTRQGVRKVCPSKDCGYAAEASGDSGEAGSGEDGVAGEGA